MNKRHLSTILLFVPLLVVLSLWYFWPKPVEIKQVKMTSLPGFEQADFAASFKAFKQSCRAFVRQRPNKQVGSRIFEMKASDWQSVCHLANYYDKPSKAQAKQFFLTHFNALEFKQGKPVTGLFTGYYMPLLHGSFHKTKRYAYPLYAAPKDRVTVNLADFGQDLPPRKLSGIIKGNKLYPLPERAQINRGAIDKHSEVLMWVDNRIDRFFLEIQGSGVVELGSGEKVYVGYAAANGAKYTAIGRVLAKKGVIERKDLSMQAIRSYLEQHPKEMDEVLHQNKSFVFFRILKQQGALGAQGVALTPGYSLAVDRKWIPLGMPIWLDTTHPGVDSKTHPLQRLMIAQDTGGAINGMVRGDVFWGAGSDATFIAGHMKNSGRYWLLVPKPRVVDFIDKSPL